jgi:integrase/recombinase XerD
MRAEGLAARTITERMRIVRAAATTIGREPDRFTTDDLLDYLAALPSASTRQAYFSALRAWHRWLCAAGQRGDDPMAGLPRPRAPRRQPHPVATAHIERLLASGIRRRTRTAVLLCAYQGLRVHEAAKIRGEDVDLIAHTLRVVGKGGVDELLPLHPVVAAEAEHYPRRGYWFPSYARPSRPVCSTSLSAVISRAMHRAGVPGTAHSLRHWFGTELLRGGADARTVQTLMRHASLATTALYTLVNSDQQRAALHMLPGLIERNAS